MIEHTGRNLMRSRSRMSGTKFFVWVLLGSVCIISTTGTSHAQTCSYFESRGLTCREALYAPQQSGDGEINASSFDKSLAASILMGLDFFNGSVDVSMNTLLDQCRLRNPAVNATWPEGCGPEGMDQALKDLGHPNWIDFATSQQSSAMNSIVSAIENIRSPATVPIYGQADHWVTIFRLARNASGALSHIVYYDATIGCCDQGLYTGTDGFQSQPVLVWQSSYYKLLTGFIGSTDNYYNKYVGLYDPPPGYTGASVEEVVYASPQSPLKPGETMSLELARQLVWHSLQLAGLESYIQSAVSEAHEVAAWRVHGVWPDGSAWSHYLVAFLDPGGSLLGMVQLDADTGAYQGSWIPTTPQPFYGIGYEQARSKASSVLASGETLLAGLLTWDPSALRPISRSPWAPYYEFEIRSKRGEPRGAVFVGLQDGTVVHDADACQMTRHQRPLQCYYQ